MTIPKSIPLDATNGDQWQIWMDEFQNESDRACALLGAAFLDDQLRQLLEHFFVDDRQIAGLFENASALSTFSSRIELAFALGFIALRELRDLRIIRKIRNDFAHGLMGLSFQSDGISSRCRELKQCDVITSPEGIQTTNRDRFVLSVVMLANWIAIRRLGIRDTRRTIQREPSHHRWKSPKVGLE